MIEKLEKKLQEYREMRDSLEVQLRNGVNEVRLKFDGEDGSSWSGIGINITHPRISLSVVHRVLSDFKVEIGDIEKALRNARATVICRPASDDTETKDTETEEEQ